MKLFKFKADAHIYAEDIDDALLRISRHYLTLVISSGEGENLFIDGYSTCGAVESNQPEPTESVETLPTTLEI